MEHDAHGSVEALEIADEDALERTDLGCVFGAAQARAEAHEDRAAGEVAHGGVGDGDVLEQGAVDGFERVAVAALEDAVGDGDVDEAAVRFGAALDAAGAVRARAGGNFFQVPSRTVPSW